MAEKLKFAVYWATSCGGCDVAIVDLCEDILSVVEVADIVFWPCALDFKYKDVEAMEDKSIDVCLFNGAIRNSDQEKVAKLLREKSKTVVAFGSCACFGGIPGLANFTNREEIFKSSYQETPSTNNPENTLPQTSHNAPEGELTLPEFYNTVSTLADVIKVEYLLPGCAPPKELIMTAVNAIVKGELPPVGSTIAGVKTLCDECDREKGERKIKEFIRPDKIKPDPKKCFLDQGILCLGPVTRSGCGQRCINANMPCRGCFGPSDYVHDMGAKILGGITSIIDSNDEEEIKKLTDQIVDPAGTFYRFTLPYSLLKRKIMKKEEV